MPRCCWLGRLMLVHVRFIPIYHGMRHLLDYCCKLAVRGLEILKGWEGSFGFSRTGFLRLKWQICSTHVYANAIKIAKAQRNISYPQIRTKMHFFTYAVHAQPWAPFFLCAEARWDKMSSTAPLPFSASHDAIFCKLQPARPRASTLWQISMISPSLHFRIHIYIYWHVLHMTKSLFHIVSLYRCY